MVKETPLKLTVDFSDKEDGFLERKLSANVWKLIKRITFEKCGFKCSICGSLGRLKTHTVWHYDEFNRIKRLVGFQGLCENCYDLKQIDKVYENVYKKRWSKSKMESLENHFQEVNGTSKECFTKHLAQVREERGRTSLITWDIEINFIDELIEEEIEKTI